MKPTKISVLTFLLIYLTKGIESTEEDVSIYINRLTPYLGDSGITITCEGADATIQSPQFVMINMKSPLMNKRPFLTLSKFGNSSKMEWGKYFDDTFHISKRMKATGELNRTKSYLTVEMQDIQCTDEAVYECMYAGFDIDGNFREVTTQGELAVYSYHDRPHITVNGVPYAGDYTPIEVKAGEEVNLLCEGKVGKPPVPMVWKIMYMIKDGAFRELTNEEGVIGKGFRELPPEELCRFHSTVPLKFVMPDLADDAVLLSCQTGLLSTEVMFRVPDIPQELHTGGAARNKEHMLKSNQEHYRHKSTHIDNQQVERRPIASGLSENPTSSGSVLLYSAFGLFSCMLIMVTSCY